MPDKVDNIYYVYIHRRKSDNLLFYVGKGKNNRYISKSGRNKHWKNVVNKHGFISKKLKINMTENEALLLEEILINRIGINNLTNCNFFNGGKSGYTHSEKSKKKMSISKLGKTAWNKGLKLPSLSESRKGDKNPHWGKKTIHTQELKQKFREKFGTLVCDLNTGIFFDSIVEATKAYCVSNKKILKKVSII